MKRTALQLALLIQNEYSENVTKISEENNHVYIETLSGKTYIIYREK